MWRYDTPIAVLALRNERIGWTLCPKRSNTPTPAAAGWRCALGLRLPTTAWDEEVPVSQLVRCVRRPALVLAVGCLLLRAGQPPVLTAAIVLFLLLHSRFDAHDPKVGRAPVEEDAGLGFRTDVRSRD